MAHRVWLVSDDSEHRRQTRTGNSSWPTWASGWRQNCLWVFGVWILLLNLVQHAGQLYQLTLSNNEPCQDGMNLT
ncbi:hypothetical protein H671_6g15451 [Cricetulus griseus]|uniref:Uncharacterized protein n=1 Tax=Cricetulus griseus TaxID=10029 RepID=A0A061HY32_CRIGR|nr:hypothetical protein H671_6g15451 [Cricetulus griseus]